MTNMKCCTLIVENMCYNTPSVMMKFEVVRFLISISTIVKDCDQQNIFFIVILREGRQGTAYVVVHRD